MDKIKPVLDWIKGHLLITTMSVLIVAFLVAGYYFSAQQNEGLKSAVDARKREFQKIEQASKTSVSLALTKGTFSGQGALNQRLLDSLSVVTTKMGSDVLEARAQALAHNGDPYPDQFPHPPHADRLGSNGKAAKGAKKLVVEERLFPSPPRASAENLPVEIYRGLNKAYSTMLDNAGAGAPPPSAELEDEIKRERSNYIQRDLNKGTEGELDEGERYALREKLGETRLQLYNEAAEKVSFYASRSAFALPEDPFTTRTQHSLAEMYDWQWDLWVAQDVIAAIARANVGANGEKVPVTAAPVKRLIKLVASSPAVVDPKSSGSSSGVGSGRSMGGRTGARGGSGGSPSSSAASGMPLGEPNISLDVATSRDFASSITGRVSNDLYDVRDVEVTLVIETDRIPVFLDALAAENFISITDLSLRPADAFKAARGGYMFGSKPVSRVKLQLETIWFRKWTAPWMPTSVREALGISTTTGAQG